jgi:hypothetical protein
MLEELEEVSYDSILGHFKDNHYHKLFVKKVNENGSLVMIYNNLDTAKENKLYQECRSIIYDTKERRVVSYSHDNVTYCQLDKYVREEGDVIEQSFEGTMIGVYYYGDRWYFSSTRCPDVNKSFYFNQKKSHGEMLDEVLGECFPGSEDVRGEFVKHLNESRIYYFVLVHHENQYLVDYSNQFGDKYRFLVHIITRDKDTQNDIMKKDELSMTHVFYPKTFQHEEVAEYLSTSKLNEVTNKVENIDGVIVKRLDKETNKIQLFKIPSVSYSILRYERPNNLNTWLNCIEIFQRNNKNYTADTYLKKYTNLEMKDLFGTGKHLDVTGVLCAIIKALALELMAVHAHFTKYDKTSGRYEKLNADDYKPLEELKNLRVLKVTLNRLQNYQYKYLKDNFTMSNVVDHLRYYSTPDDIMELIKIHDYLRKENHALFKILNTNITNKETIDRFMKTYVFYFEN